MQRPETTAYHQFDTCQLDDGPIKAIDFTVDSAGNVAPLEKQETSPADRAPPQHDALRRSG